MKKDVRNGKLSGKVLSTVLVIAMCLSGFVFLANQTKASGVREEKMLRIAMQDDMKTLNPLASSDVWTANVLNWLWDSPIYVDPETDKLVPYLANGTTNVTVDSYFNFDDPNTLDASELAKSPVGKVCTVWYNFTKAKWHDDLPITVEDILFAFYAQAALPGWGTSVACLKDKGGEAGSNYSTDHYMFINPVYISPDGKIVGIRFYLQTNYAEFLRNTLSVFLLPMHIWSTTVSGQASDDVRPWFPKGDAREWKSDVAEKWDGKVNGVPKVVGNGPFKFIYWDKGQRSKIETWRDHFYSKQPIIDSILYVIFRTPEQAVLALQNNEVDYIAWSIPPSFISEMQQDENIGLSQSAERGFFYMAYNMRRPSFGYDAASVDKAVAFRRAVAHCVDKQYIVERLLQNYGVVAHGPVSSLDTEWYNDSLVKYAFDVKSAIEVLQQAHYVEPDWSNAATLGTAANCWKNSDGSNIGSEPDGKIKILTPQGDYDPVRYQAGIMIANNLKKAGIYAESVPMDFGSIVEKINAHEFDMYILGWRIGSDPTDFLWAFFHSAGTQNYPGYHNASFDTIIDEARDTTDLNVRHERVKQATGVIAMDQPYHVLYFRQNIEAYRADNFVGWKVGSSGTILSWKSLLEIHPPSTKYLRVQVSTDSAVVSNGTAEVTVTVRDQDKNPVADATVVMDVTEGNLSAKTGTTDSNGRFTVTFSAPYVSGWNNTTEKEVGISVASASKEGYDIAPGKLVPISIVRADVDFLALKIELDTDVVNEKESTSFTVTVRNGRLANRPPVEGVALTAQASGTSKVTPATATTDADGKATFTFTAPDVEANTPFEVLINAELAPYLPGAQPVQIDVLPVIIPPDGNNHNWLPSLEPIVIIGLIAAVTVVAVAYRRRK
ncbi:MAG: Ig-like domain-containing protein [Euryarchaeota archaeon]|nr:Ig-like domain-containing protein [Euryarchaeota archaeon]